MSVTCPCCASAKAVRPYTLPRYPDDHKTHFCRDCDCEWNESRRSGSAGQWRPISEAPKDGTRILCVLESGYYVILQWNRDAEYWQARPDGQTWTPTHWMPLPPPPGAREG